MKAALVHDYLKEYGGSERVLEVFHEIWPDADVYTTVYLPEYLGPHKDRFRGWKIKPSVLQYLPFKAKLISFIRFVDFFVFKALDLSNYDLVLVNSAGSYSSLNFFKKSKRTLHMCYYHTPPRYLYGYSTANKWTNTPFRRFLFFLGKIPMYFLRKLDRRGAQIPDYLLTNSQEVKKRINKFYGRSAQVIYPPVDISSIKKYVVSSKQVNKEEYFLAGGRLARAKRVDLAVKACTKLNLPLKVYGKQFGGYGSELEKMAGQTVEFLGEITESQKYNLMAHAKGFIFPSEFEDFGITPVEAMATGTPIIASRTGGVLETIVEGQTGVFFDGFEVGSVISAIKKFEKITWDRNAIKKHAQKFSKERFVKEFSTFVNKITSRVQSLHVWQSSRG